MINNIKTNKKVQSAWYSLFLWHPILVLALGILDFVGKGVAPFAGQLVGKNWKFFFSCFPCSYGPSFTRGSFEMVSWVTGL
jgi:hypothetical protein